MQTHRPCSSLPLGFTLLSGLVLAACSGSEGPGEITDSASHAPIPHDVACTPDFQPAGEWERLLTPAIVELGGPVHSVADAVTNPGVGTEVRAKLAYGPSSKDLEGERAVAFLALDGGCDWVAIGDGLTDGDGRVTFPVDADLVPEPGRYPFRVVVEGDGSSAFGFVHVMARGTPVVVFDIDGTLTTDDLELADGIVLHTVESSSERLIDLAGSPLSKQQWLWGLEQVLEEDAAMWEGAVDVTEHWARQGYQPVYVTGRPYLYDGMTRRWLADHGFPAGPLRLTDGLDASLPTGVADYKTRALEDLRDRLGLELHAAYGNATTDICAYARAGIAAERTFIIGKHAGAACEEHAPTQAVESYPAHLDSL